MRLCRIQGTSLVVGVDARAARYNLQRRVDVRCKFENATAEQIEEVRCGAAFIGWCMA